MSKNEELLNKKFTASDFELVQDDVKISDTKFESKPTTFFKDSIKRFSKNKSSIVGAFILGILIILAIFLPIFSPYDIDTVKKSEQFLAPKLFEVEDSDWWNGTKKYSHIIYDTENEAPAGFYKPAVVSMTIDQEPTYIDQANNFGKGGYVMFVNENDGGNKTLSSYPTTINNNGNYSGKNFHHPPPVVILYGNLKNIPSPIFPLFANNLHPEFPGWRFLKTSSSVGLTCCGYSAFQRRWARARGRRPPWFRAYRPPRGRQPWRCACGRGCLRQWRRTGRR